MRRYHATALALVGFATLFLITACTSFLFGRAEIANQAKNEMIGMSKEQVLACMGAPSQQAVVGQTEVWSYPSGGDTNTFSTATASGETNTFSTATGSVAPSGNISAFDTSQTSGNVTAFGTSHHANRYCIVNVVMSVGRVTAVNYTGRTGGLISQGEQCAFAVQNCVQH